MKLFLLLIALHISLSGICQSKIQSNSIDFYFNPVNVRVGNLNNQRIIVDHDRIHVNYNKYITQEVGVRFNHKLKKSRFSLLYGVYYKQIKYGYVLTIDGASSLNGDASNFIFNTERSIGLLGLKIGISSPILTSTLISLSMEIIMIPYYDSSKDGFITDQSFLYFSRNSNQITSENRVKFYELIGGAMNEGISYLIPELNFQTQIWKNLSLNYGIKLKLWGKYNLIDIEAKGYYDVPTDQDTILFKSKVNTSQVITYFGLAYTFKLKKKNKPE